MSAPQASILPMAAKLLGGAAGFVWLVEFVPERLKAEFDVYDDMLMGGGLLNVAGFGGALAVDAT